MNIHEFYEQLEADFGYVPKEVIDDVDVNKVSDTQLKKWIVRDFTAKIIHLNENHNNSSEYIESMKVLERVHQIH